MSLDVIVGLGGVRRLLVGRGYEGVVRGRVSFLFCFCVIGSDVVV